MIEVLIWCDECKEVIERGKNLRYARARAGNQLMRIGKQDFHIGCRQLKEKKNLIQSGKGMAASSSTS